jgi:hypothetical protein
MAKTEHLRAKEKREKCVSAQSVLYKNSLRKLRLEYKRIKALVGPERGYAFGRFLGDLARASNIHYYPPYTNGANQQFDGAIKFDHHYYILELKNTNERTNHEPVAVLLTKLDDKMEAARGIMISLSGYNQSAIKSRNNRVLLLDGQHIEGILEERYTFDDLLEEAVTQAHLFGKMYCSHAIPMRVTP